MLCIILIATSLPVPCFHRLLASGKILLSDERLLVSGNLRQILATLVHHLRYRREAHTCKQFILRRTGAALGLLAQIQAVTIRILRCGYSVGAKKHLGAAVLAVFTRFTERTGDAIDTGTPFYFCHFSSAFFHLAPHEGFRLKFFVCFAG